MENFLNDIFVCMLNNKVYFNSLYFNSYIYRHLSRIIRCITRQFHKVSQRSAEFNLALYIYWNELPINAAHKTDLWTIVLSEGKLMFSVSEVIAQSRKLLPYYINSIDLCTFQTNIVVLLFILN